MRIYVACHGLERRQRANEWNRAGLLDPRLPRPYMHDTGEHHFRSLFLFPMHTHSHEKYLYLVLCAPFLPFSVRNSIGTSSISSSITTTKEITVYDFTYLMKNFTSWAIHISFTHASEMRN